MAPKVYSIILLCLVVRASFPLTLLRDAKIKDLSNIVHELEEKTTSNVFDPHLRPEEDIEHVPSLTSATVFPSEDLGEGKHGRRVKRNFIVNGKCADGWVKVNTGCLKMEAANAAGKNETGDNNKN